MSWYTSALVVLSEIVLKSKQAEQSVLVVLATQCPGWQDILRHLPGPGTRHHPSGIFLEISPWTRNISLDQEYLPGPRPGLRPSQCPRPRRLMT